MSASSDTLIARTTSLLDAQRAALVEGDLVALDKMAPALEGAMTRLQNAPLSQQQMIQITTLARRNSELIAAAQRGVASARNRLSPPQSTDLMTYGSHGQRATTGPREGRLLSRR